MEPSKNDATSSTAKAEGDDDLLGQPAEDVESPEEKLFREDSQILMSLVPEEIWDQIFSDYFNGTAEEFLYLINSSPIFHSLLSSHRTLYLFQNIFPFLQPYLSDSSSGTRKFSHSLLPLRSVCSLWSSTVDSFIHTKSIQNFVNSTPENHLELDAIQSSSFHEFRSNRLAKLTAIINHFAFSHLYPLVPRNPFIGTTVNISITQGTPYPHPFFQRMEYLLRHHGRHIRQSKLTIDFDPAFYGHYLLWILTGLTLMPLLEQLHIQIRGFDRAPNGLRDLERLLGNPLFQPKLTQLKVLRLDKNAVTLERQLARENAQSLKTLWLPQLSDSLDFEIFKIPFPNLETLEMGVGTKRGMVNLLKAGKYFCGQPKLKKLIFTCCLVRGFVRWSTVFKALKMQIKWGGVLKKVVLRLPQAKREENRKKILEDSKMKRVGLWKVTCLEMEVWNEFHLDFLRPLKDYLEELRITCNGSENSEIKFLGWEDELESSSYIWEVFWKLEKLVILRNGKEKTWYRCELPKIKDLCEGDCGEESEEET